MLLTSENIQKVFDHVKKTVCQFSDFQTTCVIMGAQFERLVAALNYNLELHQYTPNTTIFNNIS